VDVNRDGNISYEEFYNVLKSKVRDFTALDKQQVLMQSIYIFNSQFIILNPNNRLWLIFNFKMS